MYGSQNHSKSTLKIYHYLVEKRPLALPGESQTGLWISRILKVVVTNGKLRVALLNIALVNYANIAASKDRTFLGIVCYCKLG